MMGFLGRLFGKGSIVSEAEIREMFENKKLNGTQIKAVAILYHLDIAPYPPRQMAEAAVQRAVQAGVIGRNIIFPISAMIKMKGLPSGEEGVGHTLNYVLDSLASMLAEQVKAEKLYRISAIAVEGGGRHGDVWTAIAAQ